MKSLEKYIQYSVVFTLLVLSGCGIFNVPNTISKGSLICSDYSNTSQNELPVSLIHDMVNSYRSFQKNEIDSSQQMIDARSIWFSLDSLKRFLYHIESLTTNTDSTKTGGDLGVRIYYAAYPDSSKWRSSQYNKSLEPFFKNKETLQYSQLHTLVMVPTIQRGGLNVDFNPVDRDSYTQSLRDLSDRYSQSSNLSTIAFGVSAPGSSTGNNSSSNIAQNHGSLIPPRDPGFNEEGFGQ